MIHVPFMDVIYVLVSTNFLQVKDNYLKIGDVELQVETQV
jgi:hypothetical protein